MRGLTFDDYLKAPSRFAPEPRATLRRAMRQGEKTCVPRSDEDDPVRTAWLEELQRRRKAKERGLVK